MEMAPHSQPHVRAPRELREDDDDDDDRLAARDHRIGPAPVADKVAEFDGQVGLCGNSAVRLRCAADCAGGADAGVE